MFNIRFGTYAFKMWTSENWKNDKDRSIQDELKLEWTIITTIKNLSAKNSFAILFLKCTRWRKKSTATASSLATTTTTTKSHYWPVNKLNITVIITYVSACSSCLKQIHTKNEREIKYRFDFSFNITFMWLQNYWFFDVVERNNRPMCSHKNHHYRLTFTKAK